MLPRPLVVVAALALAGGAVGWAAATTDRAFRPRYEGDPPNVLFLSIDTLRADRMSLYGHDRATTPEIDRWAEDAVVFEDAQASASWTLPGLASVLTSFYTSTHGCWSFDSRLDPSFVTLPEILTAAGYDSMCVTSHVFLARRYGLQQGFVHFDDEFAHPTEDPNSVITSHLVTDKGIRFLEQKAGSPDDAPWMLWLHYFDPHGIYNEHPGVSEEFGTLDPATGKVRYEEIDLYDGEIRYTDLHVGRLLRRLEELGLAQDTVVVFFSDHGEEFLDHGGLRHGHALWRELVRVPLVIKAPGVAPRRVPERVRTVDLLPTVLELVPPLAPPDEVEGQSLLPLMRGRDRAPLPALSEIRLQESASLDSLLDGRWKLIVDSKSGKEQLFDVEADPLETRDLAAESPEVVRDLRETLDRTIERARVRARGYGRSEALGITETERDHLKGLGYIGED